MQFRLRFLFVLTAAVALCAWLATTNVWLALVIGLAVMSSVLAVTVAAVVATIETLCERMQNHR